MKKMNFELKILQENAKSLKVLLIENHAGTRFKLSKFLKKYFLDIQVCLDPDIAIQAFNKSKFDLIIIDAHLKEVSSFQICTIISDLSTENRT